MLSPKSKASNEVASPSSPDIDLPLFDEAMKEHWPLKISWAEAVQQFAPFRDYYMRRFDSPEKRLRKKNPARFRLP